jgi:hypothetical protein
MSSASRSATPDYPNIVPPNNLRLPDALTIKHGPTPLLARFVLEGDKAARDVGLHLRLRHDFDELAYLNRQNVPRGNWFRLVNAFNPEYADLSPANSFWISGEDDGGDVVTSWAARVYYWPDTNLEEQARVFFYERDEGQPCIVTAPAAKMITGVVLSGGAAWVRPDYRGRQLSQLVPRIGKAYAYSRWPVDWSICYVSRILIEKGVGAGYGQKNFSYSIFYPGSPWGELEVVLAYTAIADAYDDLADFMATTLLGGGVAAAAVSTTVDHPVTKTSLEEVFHGSSSLS